jgi:hypothetical protein
MYRNFGAQTDRDENDRADELRRNPPLTAEVKKHDRVP